MRIDHPIGYYARMTGSFTGSFHGNLTGFIDSASFATTASYAYYAISASHEVTYEVSSSYAETASFTDNATSASYALTASHVLGTSETSSYALTASYVEQSISSSHALTSSYVENAISSSYAVTASHVEGLVESASYAATSSITDTAISASHVASAITSLSGSDSDTVYGVQMGGVISSIVINNVDTALTASFVVSSSYAQTASYVESVESASYAVTSSYSHTTISASYALTASYLDGSVESNAALVYTGSRGNIIPISGAHYVDDTDSFLYSTVGGGLLNTASGSYSTVAGGDQNIAGRSHAFIGGGDRNCALGNCSIVMGGTLNKTYGPLSVVGGGYSNCATGSYGVIVGGFFNQNGGARTFIGGGQSNKITAVAFGSTIGGGVSNCVAACKSVIAGGTSNKIFTGNSSIGGGFCNCITSTSTSAGSAIGGGIRNSILDSGCFAVIAGGRCSATSGDYSGVLGGCENTMTGAYSSIIGGCLNINGFTNSHVIGSNITTDKNDYTFVNNLDNLGSTLLRGETQVKEDLFVMNSAMSSKHGHLRSNGTEGYLKLSNGTNWGLIARGEGNTPYLGGYYAAGGSLTIRGFGSNDGSAHSNDKDIMKFVFTPATNQPHAEIRDYKTGSTEALRITFPNVSNPGAAAEWISFFANGVEFDTIEGDSSGGAVFTGRAAGTTSDLRNKRDIVPVTDTANSLEIVKGLEVIEFAYKSDTREVPERKIGFSAQQLLEVYPQPVSTFEDKNKENNLKPGDPGFKYHKVSEGTVTPLLVSAIQEQQKLIEELRQEIDSLKK